MPKIATKTPPTVPGPSGYLCRLIQYRMLQIFSVAEPSIPHTAPTITICSAAEKTVEKTAGMPRLPRVRATQLLSLHAANGAAWSIRRVTRHLVDECLESLRIRRAAHGAPVPPLWSITQEPPFVPCNGLFFPCNGILSLDDHLSFCYFICLFVLMSDNVVSRFAIYLSFRPFVSSFRLHICHFICRFVF